jgi:hypothetical protein
MHDKVIQMDRLPCIDCICLANCISNIPDIGSEGYEDLDIDDNYFFWQYVNELINTCSLMGKYISGDKYDNIRTRRQRASHFFRDGY